MIAYYGANLSNIVLFVKILFFLNQYIILQLYALFNSGVCYLSSSSVKLKDYFFHIL